jgi:Tol biopolymer transport system component
LAPAGEPTPFQRTDHDESAPAFSPDGKWLAYVSDESGRSAVWVQPFPGPGSRWLVSPDGRSVAVVHSEGAAGAEQFNVVLNWFAELRSRR